MSILSKIQNLDEIFLINSVKSKKDPAVKIREQCTNDSKCKPFGKALEECNKRVSSNPGSSESCQEELYDFLRCVDDCVSKKIHSYFNRFIDFIILNDFRLRRSYSQN